MKDGAIVEPIIDITEKVFGADGGIDCVEFKREQVQDWPEDDSIRRYPRAEVRARKEVSGDISLYYRSTGGQL